MKTCPFCKEEIKDDAIKCKYCQSLLLPIQPDSSISNKPLEDEDKKGTITYILDKDLIRFGKFGFFILGMFTIIGVYLYGIDIKEVSKSQDETKAKLENLKKDLDIEQNEINNAKKELTDQKTELRVANDSFLQVQSVLQAQNQNLSKVLKSTADKVEEDSRNSNLYLNGARDIYKKLKDTIEPKAEALLNTLAGKVINAEGTQIERLKDSTYSIFSGAEITMDNNSYGRIGYYLQNVDGVTFGICSSPIFPINNADKQVFLIATNKSIVPLGTIYKQSKTTPMIGLVKIESFNPKNLTSQFEKIQSIRNINDKDIDSEVHINFQNNNLKGRIKDFQVSVELEGINKIYIVKSVIVTTIPVQPGLSGSVLLDKENHALGVLVGATDLYSYFVPLSEIINEFQMEAIK